MGVTAAAWLRSRKPDHEALASLRDQYRTGVAQGTWHQVLFQTCRFAADDETAPPSLRTALHRTQRGKLLEHLGKLVQERNRSAHGARPWNSAEAATRVEEIRPALEAALSSSRFLADLPWILTESTSYRVRTKDFDVLALRAMGDHPEFERQRLLSAVPLADGNLFVLVEGAPVELSPFVVMRYCFECR